MFEDVKVEVRCTRLTKTIDKYSSEEDTKNHDWDVSTELMRLEDDPSFVYVLRNSSSKVGDKITTTIVYLVEV